MHADHMSYAGADSEGGGAQWEYLIIPTLCKSESFRGGQDPLFRVMGGTLWIRASADFRPFSIPEVSYMRSMQIR